MRPRCTEPRLRSRGAARLNPGGGPTVAVHARRFPLPSAPLRARPRPRGRLQVPCDGLRRLAVRGVAAWRMRCAGLCAHISRQHATRLQRTPRRCGRSEAVLPACRCRPLGFGVPLGPGCARQQPAAPPACVTTPQARSRGERRSQRVALDCGPPCAGAGCRRLARLWAGTRQRSRRCRRGDPTAAGASGSGAGMQASLRERPCRLAPGLLWPGRTRRVCSAELRPAAAALRPRLGPQRSGAISGGLLGSLPGGRARRLGGKRV